MPVLTIFLHGLLYGAHDVREFASWGIGDIVQLTPASILKPLMAQIIGPLIRMRGERISPATKHGILYALRYFFFLPFNNKKGDLMRQKKNKGNVGFDRYVCATLFPAIATNVYQDVERSARDGPRQRLDVFVSHGQTPRKIRIGFARSLRPSQRHHRLILFCC